MEKEVIRLFWKYMCKNTSELWQSLKNKMVVANQSYLNWSMLTSLLKLGILEPSQGLQHQACNTELQTIWECYLSSHQSTLQWTKSATTVNFVENLKLFCPHGADWTLWSADSGSRAACLTSLIYGVHLGCHDIPISKFPGLLLYMILQMTKKKTRTSEESPLMWK